jgi:hypothetical protein
MLPIILFRSSDIWVTPVFGYHEAILPGSRPIVADEKTSSDHNIGSHTYSVHQPDSHARPSRTVRRPKPRPATDVFYLFPLSSPVVQQWPHTHARNPAAMLHPSTGYCYLCLPPTLPALAPPPVDVSLCARTARDPAIMVYRPRRRFLSG